MCADRITIGRCYPTETLIEILKFCNKHQIHLISDEIYALCVFDSGNPYAPLFTSVLSLATPDLIDPNLVHVLYGFSKVSLFPQRKPHVWNINK